MSTIILSLSSLLVIPLMVRASGAHVWGWIALGQAVGTIGAVFVSYGWGVMGPVRIAKASEQERVNEYLGSLACRGMLLVAAAPLLLLGAGVLARDGTVAAFLSGAVFVTSTGLTSAWYFAGTQEPYVFLWTEATPRAVASIVAAVAMLRGYGAVTGIWIQALGVLLGIGVASLWILRPWHIANRRGLVRPRPLHLFRSGGAGLFSSLLANVQIALPVIVVSSAAPASMPAYALADRMMRQASNLFPPIVAVAQGWFPRVVDDPRRMQRGLRAMLALCMLVGAATWGVSPILGRFLGSGHLHVSIWTLLAMSICVSLVLMEVTAAKAVLPALGSFKTAGYAGIATVAATPPLVFLLVKSAGPAGGFLGLALGLLLKVWVELIDAKRRIDRLLVQSSVPSGINEGGSCTE